LWVRKVFTDRASADAPLVTHLDRIARLGARVRISRAELPGEMITMNRRLVVLAGPRDAVSVRLPCSAIQMRWPASAQC
jgi:hypothetical protein